MIAPIPKAAAKSSDPGNYRPISLTCILCKLLEKHILYGLMYEYLSNHQELSDSQWGFRSGRSTVTALLSVTQEWLSALECGQELRAVFFDYQKAFDSVPHLPLLEKLESIDFNHIRCWVTDYLTNRTQKVVVNGQSSLSAPVISGVPQGSVVGPLLFLIYINDLTKINLSDGAKLTLYADDILLFRTINSPNDFFALQEDIDKVGSWSCTNFLTLNRAKCKYMIVSRRRTTSTPSSPLLLEGHPLDQVKMFKYLGVLLSHDLSWGEHVQSVCSKARKILGLLYRRFYNNAPSNSLVQLYLSLVRPHLDYASAIWSPHVKKDKIALENVQKLACRMATRSWDSSYKDVLDFVDLPSLECRRLETRLCLLYKIIYKLCYFDDGIITPSTSLTHHALHNLVLNRPFARTNSYFYSFVPYTISLWNNLDSSFVCAPSVSAFKNNLQLTSLM